MKIVEGEFELADFNNMWNIVSSIFLAMAHILLTIIIGVFLISNFDIYYITLSFLVGTGYILIFAVIVNFYRRLQ